MSSCLQMTTVQNKRLFSFPSNNEASPSREEFSFLSETEDSPCNLDFSVLSEIDATPCQNDFAISLKYDSKPRLADVASVDALPVIIATSQSKKPAGKFRNELLWSLLGGFLAISATVVFGIFTFRDAIIFGSGSVTMFAFALDSQLRSQR